MEYHVCTIIVHLFHVFEADLLAIVNDITLSTREGIVSPLIERVLSRSHGGYLLGIQVNASYSHAKQHL